MLVIISVPPLTRNMRYKVRTFKDVNKGYQFLNTGDNSLFWIVVDPKNNPLGYPIKSGTYAYAGQQYHNVKNLDPSALAHI